jgi:2-keto-3-deoxy-L-fuconate dehydrogenase
MLLNRELKWQPGSMSAERLVGRVDYAADGIRSNAICPGSVATAVLDKYLSDQAEGDPEGRDVDYFLDEISSSHPVGRIADAEEVARFYVYMASDFASFFNGANLMIDGGYSSTA